MIALPTHSLDETSLELQERVALYLSQRHLTFGSRLQIAAQRGVVTLSGQVPTFHQRQLIHAFTRRVAGVVQVVDQLEVVSPVALPQPSHDPGKVLAWVPEDSLSSQFIPYEGGVMS
ncbi:MAG: BON domain-containing protein [Pirellulaceae bacterium]|nr:BON domain-containing protein [Pirellulaceae bacterium]